MSGQHLVRAARWLTENVGIAPLLLLVAFVLPCPTPGAKTLAGLPTLCPVQRFVRFPCPGCGMTRSIVSSAHGALGTAVCFHPFGPVVFLWLVATALLRVPAIRRAVPPVPARIADVGVMFLIVALLAIWGGRLLHVLPRP